MTDFGVISAKIIAPAALTIITKISYHAIRILRDAVSFGIVICKVFFKFKKTKQQNVTIHKINNKYPMNISISYNIKPNVV